MSLCAVAHGIGVWSCAARNERDYNNDIHTFDQRSRASESGGINQSVLLFAKHLPA